MPDEIPVLYGVATVARWCGVKDNAVSNWLRRYDNWPRPAAISRGPLVDIYLWSEEQRADWVRWASGHAVSRVVRHGREEAS